MFPVAGLHRLFGALDLLFGKTRTIRVRTSLEVAHEVLPIRGQRVSLLSAVAKDDLDLRRVNRATGIPPVHLRHNTSPGVWWRIQDAGPAISIKHEGTVALRELPAFNRLLDHLCGRDNGVRTRTKGVREMKEVAHFMRQSIRLKTLAIPHIQSRT